MLSRVYPKVYTDLDPTKTEWKFGGKCCEEQLLQPFLLWRGLRTPKGRWETFNAIFLFFLSCKFPLILDSSISHWNLKSSAQTDLGWPRGRDCSQPPRWRRRRPRQTASWWTTPRRRAWGRRRDCCSCCCASSSPASGPSRWGRARSGPGGCWSAWRWSCRVGTLAPGPCPLYSGRNPWSSLRGGRRRFAWLWASNDFIVVYFDEAILYSCSRE